MAPAEGHEQPLGLQVKNCHLLVAAGWIWAPFPPLEQDMDKSRTLDSPALHRAGGTPQSVLDPICVSSLLESARNSTAALPGGEDLDVLATELLN